MDLTADVFQRTGQGVQPGLPRRGRRTKKGDLPRRDAGRHEVFQDRDDQLARPRQPLVHDDRNLVIGGDGLPQRWIPERVFQGGSHGSGGIGQSVGGRGRGGGNQNRIGYFDLHPLLAQSDRNSHRQTRVTFQ